MAKIKTYYQLAKPGIIYGNIITAAAGFFLVAAPLWSDANTDHLIGRLIAILIATLIGLGLVIAGSCVFNNYYDRDIDAKMERTKSRALVTGTVSPRAALIYGSCLLVLGAIVLALGANQLTMLVALVGAIFYVALYTPLKRRTDHSALVGAIAGATPPVVGLCAVTNSLAGRSGIEALALFLILVSWQMPHFYTIAMYRGNDYQAAGIPTLPAVRGARAAKIGILLYVITFIIATASLTLLGFTGDAYLAIVLILGIVWLWICVSGFRKNRHMKNKEDDKKTGDDGSANDTAWARRMFLFSLVIITVLSIALAVGGTRG